MLILLLACEEEGIRAYRVPKEVVTTVASAPAPAASVTWTVPPAWQPAPSPEQMRIATFRAGVGATEVAVTAFPGEAGGLPANVNRWRGQLGLQPVADSDLSSAVETSQVNSVSVSTLRIAGAQGMDMLGAIIQPGDAQTWFVKATGDAAALNAIESDFLAFARSFRLAEPQDNPADAGAAPAPAPPHSGIDARLAAWSPPAHWKPESDTSGILAASFTASNAHGGARATATSLLNDGGGLLANINRWRDQLGLGPIASIQEQPLVDLGGGAVLVDLSDAQATRRMKAAIVGSGPQTWFFKLTGSPSSVEEESPHFERLVRTVGVGEQ